MSVPSKTEPAGKTGLRARIRRGDQLAGCFLKTPAPQLVEVLALSGLDFIVPDMEHAPLRLEAIDQLLGVARGVGLPLVVRVPSHGKETISAVLDAGAAGVMVPHISSGATAETVLDAMKYSRLQRGFSPSGRAGGYGTLPHAAYRAAADADCVLMAQIEDEAALGNLDEIAACDDVDLLFVGPADLALSLGCEAGDARLEAAFDLVLEAGRKHGKATGIAVGSASAIAPMAKRGFSVFVVGSDQTLVLQGGRTIAAALKS